MFVSRRRREEGVREKNECEGVSVENHFCKYSEKIKQGAKGEASE